MTRCQCIRGCSILTSGKTYRAYGFRTKKQKRKQMRGGCSQDNNHVSLSHPVKVNIFWREREQHADQHRRQLLSTDDQNVNVICLECKPFDDLWTAIETTFKLTVDSYESLEGRINNVTDDIADDAQLGLVDPPGFPLLKRTSASRGENFGYRYTQRTDNALYSTVRYVRNALYDGITTDVDLTPETMLAHVRLMMGHFCSSVFRTKRFQST